MTNFREHCLLVHACSEQQWSIQSARNPAPLTACKVLECTYNGIKTIKKLIALCFQLITDKFQNRSMECYLYICLTCSRCLPYFKTMIRSCRPWRLLCVCNLVRCASLSIPVFVCQFMSLRFLVVNSKDLLVKQNSQVLPQ